MANEIIKKRHLFYNLKFRIVLICVTIIFIIGQVFNLIWPHHMFHVNQMILLFMLVSQIYIVKKIDHERNHIREYLSQSVEPEIIGLLERKVTVAVQSPFSIFISTFFVVIYISTMFLLGYVKLSITGFYGGVLGGIVFYIGIQAYIRYISLAIFSYDIRNLEIKNYSYYVPALTDWLGKLAEVFSYIEKWFLLLGVLYTTIYALNVPIDNVYLDGKFTINSNNNILFLITWIGILLFFAIACPMLTFLTRNFIKYTIHELKGKSIRKIEKQMKLISGNSTSKELETVQKYIDIIRAIDQSSDYPLKYRRTIFDSLYSLVMGIISLLSPILTIIENSIIKI